MRDKWIGDGRAGAVRVGGERAGDARADDGGTDGGHAGDGRAGGGDAGDGRAGGGRVGERASEVWRGRVRDEGGRRAVRWGVAAVLAAIGVAATGVGPAAVAVVYLAVVTPELVRIDLRENRLPNRITLPGIAIGAMVCVAESFGGGGVATAPLAAAGAYAGVLFLLCLFGGIGMGDVKLAAALGLASWLPFVGVLSPVLAFLFGGVASTVLLVSRGRESGVARMAFGPYLLAGYWIAVALVAVARPTT